MHKINTLKLYGSNEFLLSYIPTFLHAYFGLRFYKFIAIDFLLEDKDKN